MKKLAILGIRGVPAAHGGFETFASNLCLFLVKQGWKITVYCQENYNGKIFESEWNGVKRIHIPVAKQGPVGTIIFDLKAVIYSLKQKDLILTLGYNTAIFNVLYRLFGRCNIINMDGIEWKRQKWGKIAKAWFWLNERLGCWIGNHLVADHPEIKAHLATRVRENKITMISYGAPRINECCSGPVEAYKLEPRKYSILIARAEPENSILEVVTAFSKKQRNHKLVIIGNYDHEHTYQNAVKHAASNEVIFLGAIYDQKIVSSLRYHAQLYIHGHQVGGTNPSLVEALGVGSAVLAHNNKFNRWVAGDAGFYFSNVHECSKLFNTVLTNSQALAEKRNNARTIFTKQFQWKNILTQYEELLLAKLASSRHSKLYRNAK